MESKIRQIQTAIFTKNFNISSDLERAGLLTDIYEYTKSIFNGAPTQLPIPNDAPPEFPRFILNSVDGKFSCNISLSRVDIFYNISNETTDSFEQLFETQKSNIQNIFNFLLSKNVIVNRIGFITAVEKKLAPEEGKGINYLRNSFVKDDKFANPKELLFNYNRAGRAGDFEMNNLITINAKEDSNIILQTDINTVAEGVNENNFNLVNFNEIVDYTIRETQVFVNNFPNI